MCNFDFMSKELANRLKASFDAFVHHQMNTPLELWEQFASICEVAVFRKNEVIKPAGATERYGYFILSGACGVFVWKEDKQVCLDLMFEDEFFGDHLSIITGKPSELETMALERTEVIRISSEAIRSMKSVDAGRHLFMVSAEYTFVAKQQQQIDLLLKTADERYRELLKKHPEVIKRTAQKHVASYLGITTQSLSRLRKHID
jgi:CRP/FNR family transcriptional regulator, anaerobic regulatory protein